jgi:hypothetical protein
VSLVIVHVELNLLKNNETIYNLLFTLQR